MIEDNSVITLQRLHMLDALRCQLCLRGLDGFMLSVDSDNSAAALSAPREEYGVMTIACRSIDSQVTRFDGSSSDAMSQLC